MLRRCRLNGKKEVGNVIFLSFKFIRGKVVFTGGQGIRVWQSPCSAKRRNKPTIFPWTSVYCRASFKHVWITAQTSVRRTNAAGRGGPSDATVIRRQS